jgi:hypothetical protein
VRRHRHAARTPATRIEPHTSHASPSLVERTVIAARARCRSAAAGRSSVRVEQHLSHCAIQPDVRGIANSTGNIVTGKPMAW